MPLLQVVKGITYLGQVVLKLSFPFAGLGLCAEADHLVAKRKYKIFAFLEMLFKLIFVALKLLQLLFQCLVFLPQLRVLSLHRAGFTTIDAPEDHSRSVAYGVNDRGLVDVSYGLVLDFVGEKKLRGHNEMLLW